MSGIYGLVSTSGAIPDAVRLEPMQTALSHQGSEHIFYHTAHLALGQMTRHVGLETLITNETGQLTLAFDGIIANYRELREDLIGRGHTFSTSHPAETIVHLYEEEGPLLLPLLRGPFAFAMWDHNAEQLFLACDPMAQIPLYYYEDGQQLIFASTIPTLLAHPSVPRRSLLADPAFLALGLHTGRAADAMTPFQGIRSLTAGQYLIRSAKDTSSAKKRHWRIPPLAPADAWASILNHEDVVCERLAESVRLYVTTDEPVGVFLSGGLNSSLVAVMMQQQNRPLYTFTARFSAEDAPETIRAAQVAQQLGAAHTVLTLSAPNFSDLLPRLVWHTAQPILSPHDILTALLSKAVQGQVSTALMGTGGTALFGDPLQDLKPRPRTRSVWHTASTFLQRTRAIRQREEAREEARLALFSPGEVKALIGKEPEITLTGLTPIGRATVVIASFLMQHLAPTHHVGSAYELAVHLPFSDAEVVIAAAEIPLNLKQKPGRPLYILQESAYGLLPSPLLNDPIPSEAPPLAGWLREQQAYVRDVLLGKSALKRGLFQQSVIEGLIMQHMKGKQDHSRELLALMSLEIWHQLFIDPTVVVPPIESF
jgi:asparagine synthase (glutamine-hydrolysing)